MKKEESKGEMTVCAGVCSKTQRKKTNRKKEGVLCY